MTGDEGLQAFSPLPKFNNGRHKWSKTNTKKLVCVNCHLQKYRASERVLMAITPDGKNHYKYTQHWEYIPLNKDVTKQLPKCK